MPNNTNITHLPTDETLAAGLAGIADALGATVDTAMSDSSENAVQNKVIKAYVDANAYAPFIVTMSLNGANLVADKTFGEIKAAADNNQIIIIKNNIEGFLSGSVIVTDCTAMANGDITVGWVDGGNQTIMKLTGTQNDYPTLSLE